MTKELLGTSISPSLTIRVILPLARPPLAFQATKSPVFRASGAALTVSSVLIT